MGFLKSRFYKLKAHVVDQKMCSEADEQEQLVRVECGILKDLTCKDVNNAKFQCCCKTWEKGTMYCNQ